MFRLTLPPRHRRCVAAASRPRCQQSNQRFGEIQFRDKEKPRACFARHRYQSRTLSIPPPLPCSADSALARRRCRWATWCRYAVFEARQTATDAGGRPASFQPLPTWNDRPEAARQSCPLPGKITGLNVGVMQSEDRQNFWPTDQPQSSSPDFSRSAQTIWRPSEADERSAFSG